MSDVWQAGDKPKAGRRTGVTIAITAVVTFIATVVIVVPVVFILLIAFLTILGASINDKFESIESQTQPAGQHLRLDGSSGQAGAGRGNRTAIGFGPLRKF